MNRFMLLFSTLLLFVGCGSDDQSSTTCEGLQQSACSKAPGCEAVLAIPLDERMSCREEARFIGCEESALCEVGESFFALDSRGSSHELSADCSLADWAATEAKEALVAASSGPLCDDVKERCAGLTPMQCEDAPECPQVVGWRYDRGQDCREPLIASCDGWRQGCSEQEVRWARDPLGTLWIFPTGCAPEGWTLLEGERTSEEIDASKSPECTDEIV